MKLFNYKDYKLQISPEAYALKPFAKLVKRDRSKDYNQSNKELAYLYFMYDPRSDFSFEINEEDRKERVIASVGLSPTWEPDKVMLEAIELYKELTTTSASILLTNTRVLVNNISHTFSNLDMSALDSDGRLLHNMGQIMTAVKQVPSVIKELAEAEKTVAKEIEAAGKMRGDKQKSILEDGLQNYLHSND